MQKASVFEESSTKQSSKDLQSRFLASSCHWWNWLLVTRLYRKVIVLKLTVIQVLRAVRATLTQYLTEKVEVITVWQEQEEEQGLAIMASE